MNEPMANIVEACLEMEIDGQGVLYVDTIRENARQLYQEAMERHLMLQRFVGMAQERTWPSLETINEARTLLGMEPITATRTI